MDFARARVTYYSQAHCAGHVVHWQADAVTQVPISVVARIKDYPLPMLPSAIGSLPSQFISLAMGLAHKQAILGTDIRAKVMLDGHSFTANIDTGLDASTINSKAARDDFDVAADDPAPDAAQAGNRNGEDQPAPSGTETVVVTGLRRQHRFHSLTFGGVTVTNPLFVLKPGPLGPHKVGDPLPPDITIGMNVLKRLHLYFAFGERVLYVSASQTNGDNKKDAAP
jgi:hypothetical protein